MVSPTVNQIPLLVIMGPTAVGKTRVAVDLCRQLGGEVVSADSMQVYRGLDIGTAKPLPSHIKGAPHHLVDVVDPGELFSVARFKEMAWAAIRDIWGRGRLPLLVGGTGLYLRAVVDNFPVDRVPPDQAYRRRLSGIAALRGPDYLHRRLATLDPASAGRIHPRDLKRVIRSLEIYRRTGRGRTEIEAQGERSPYDPVKAVLYLPRQELYQRIDRRVDEMMAAGWENEVAGLLERGLRGWLTASQALGYGIVADMVEGKIGRQAAVDLIKQKTRQYAKRQLTWFRREPDSSWVEATSDAVPVIATRVAGNWPDLAKR